MRHEDLVERPLNVLKALSRQHRVNPAESLWLIRKIVLPASWDNLEPELHWVDYEPVSKNHGSATSSLSPRMSDIVMETINWTTMAAYGYRPVVETSDS